MDIKDLFARKLEFQGVSGQNRGLKRKIWKGPRAGVQKDLIRTAGSISRKLGGVCAKIWADLELILKALGPRVKSTKVQGLFS